MHVQHKRYELRIKIYIPKPLDYSYIFIAAVVVIICLKYIWFENKLFEV